MANAFFKLIDHRNTVGQSNSVRLAHIDCVSDPQSVRNDWVVYVHMRNGTVYTMSGDISTIYRKRDELMHALDQDALREPVRPLNRPAAGFDPLRGGPAKLSD